MAVILLSDILLTSHDCLKRQVNPLRSIHISLSTNTTATVNFENSWGARDGNQEVDISSSRYTQTVLR